MPNQPKTQHRSIRVPDDLWHAAQVRAAEQGETVTAVVLRALNAYTDGPTPSADPHTPTPRPCR